MDVNIIILVKLSNGFVLTIIRLTESYYKNGVQEVYNKYVKK